ncbi:hypothetical protein ACFLYP_04520, partial [Chloroflexota bacterium]
VIDGGGDMQWGDTWQDGVDAVNDVWLFDIGSNGSVNLIIKYQVVGQRYIADLYDDRDGDGQVNHSIEGQNVIILESEYWTMRVESEGSWWRADGNPNSQVAAWLDGPPSYISEQVAAQYMWNDGKPDVLYRQVDSDFDGAPEYFLSNLITDIPSNLKVIRSSLYVNLSENIPKAFGNALYWPFLSLLENKIPLGKYFEYAPVIKVDWEKSRLLGFQLHGIMINEGYRITSYNNIEKEVVNSINFEVPVAWYDFGGDRWDAPEANARLFISPSGPTAWQYVRYSWRNIETPANLWDYAVSGVGLNPFGDVVDFGEFQLKKVGYQELPFWITDQEWMLMTFVCREGGILTGYEGITIWSPWQGADLHWSPELIREANSAVISYISGETANSPEEYFKEISIGYRGEYIFDRPKKPILYMSGVDHELHLKGAEYGLFNLDGFRNIEYADLDQDGYFDQWTLKNGGQIERQLIYYENLAILNEGQSIIIRLIEDSIVLFEIQPPRTLEEWGRYDQIMGLHKVDFEADDFKRFFEQFDGQETRLDNALIRDFRHLDDGGYRFILSVLNGLEVSGQDVWGVAGLPPGDYVVSYQGELDLRPASGSGITMVLLGNAFEEGIINRELVFPILLENTSSYDYDEIALEVYIEGAEDPIYRDNLSIYSETSQRIIVKWVPTSAGHFKLTFKFLLDEQHILEQDVLVNISEEGKNVGWDVLILTSGNGQRILAFLLLIIIFGFAVYI